MMLIKIHHSNSIHQEPRAQRELRALLQEAVGERIFAFVAQLLQQRILEDGYYSPPPPGSRLSSLNAHTNVKRFQKF